MKLSKWEVVFGVLTIAIAVVCIYAIVISVEDVFTVYVMYEG